MRKGKPRHVPMFLRSENKKVFFTFFSYFMSKNDLDIIFEHYDIGLIILTKIHNIRKKFEDEKNNVQKNDNNLNVEEAEIFEEKVRAFFLNYNIDPPIIQNDNIQNEAKYKNENKNKNSTNAENNQEKQKKSNVTENNSLKFIAKTEKKKRSCHNKEQHHVIESANKNVDHSIDTQIVTQCSNVTLPAQIKNPHEIIHDESMNKNTLKSIENIDNHEAILKNIKFKVEKCNDENPICLEEQCEQLYNRSISSITSMSLNNNIPPKPNILNISNKKCIELKKKNVQEIENSIKVERNDKNQMRKEVMCENVETQQYQNKEKEKRKFKNTKKGKESKMGKQQDEHPSRIQILMVEVKRENMRNETNMDEDDKNGGETSYTGKNHAIENQTKKCHYNENIKSRRESEDIIFPARKKNETYKKFSKRINRRRMNEFMDSPDEYCFYITDLCKKGTMLSLKKNELAHDKKSKYKFSFYPKFMESFASNEYIPFNRELQPLNNMRIDLSLFRQINENARIPSNLNELNSIENCKEKSLFGSFIPFNECDIFQNCYGEDDNHVHNHTYTLDNVDNIIYNTCDYSTSMNLQNDVFDINTQYITSSVKNSGNQNETDILNLNNVNESDKDEKDEKDDKDIIIEIKDKECCYHPPTNKCINETTIINNQNNASIKLKIDKYNCQCKDQYIFQNNKINQLENITKKKPTTGGKYREKEDEEEEEENKKKKEETNLISYIINMVKSEPTHTIIDGQNKLHNQGDSNLCTNSYNGALINDYKNQNIDCTNMGLENNILHNNKCVNNAYPSYVHNSNYKGNSMLNNYLNSNNFENYLMNSNSVNCNIKNMSLNSNNSTLTNMYNCSDMKTLSENSYFTNSDNYYFNKDSISIMADRNIFNDNTISSCNLNVNYFKNDTFNIRKSFSHNNYYHNLNPYCIFKYNNDDNMTIQNYYKNSYTRMNNRSNSYTNGRITNSAIHFLDQRHINIFAKSYMKHNFIENNLTNNNSSSSMYNHVDHTNYPSNGINTKSCINEHSTNHLINMQNKDKNEFTYQNSSITNLNHLLNVSYHNNTNNISTITHNEIFSDLKQNYFENQIINSANIITNFQSMREQEINKIQALLPNRPNEKKCSFKMEISPFDEPSRLHSIPFNKHSDELSLINENSGERNDGKSGSFNREFRRDFYSRHNDSANLDYLKKVKQEMENQATELEEKQKEEQKEVVENFTHSHHIDCKEKITQAGGPNNNLLTTQGDSKSHTTHRSEYNYVDLCKTNNEENYQNIGLNYLLMNSTNTGEDKESNISVQPIHMQQEDQTNYPFDDKNMLLYNNTLNFVKHEEMDLYETNLREINRQEIKLENGIDQLFPTNADHTEELYQQHYQHYHQQNFHSDHPQFSIKKQNELCNQNRNIFHDLSNQEGSIKLENHNIHLYKYQQNDNKNVEKTKISNNDRIQLTPPICHPNCPPYQLICEKHLEDKNEFNKIREEIKNTQNYSREIYNNILHSNNTTNDIFDTNIFENIHESRIENINETSQPLSLEKKDEMSKRLFLINHDNDNQNRIKYKLNTVNCFKVPNSYYNNEEEYNKVKNINRMLVQNSENYILTKQEFCSDSNSDNINLQPYDMNHFPISVPNDEQDEFLINGNTNVDTIKNKISSNGNNNHNLQHIKRTTSNTINTINNINTISTIKKINNMNIHTNNILNKRLNKSENQTSNFNYARNENTNASKYMINNHFNAVDQLQHYTDNTVITQNCPQMGDQHNENKFLCFKNKNDFEHNNIALMTNVQNDNYNNRTNTNMENINFMDSHHIFELQNDANNNYIPYQLNEGNSYNEHLNTQLSCCEGKLENANPFTDEDVINMYNNFYIENYHIDNNYNEQNHGNTYEQNVINHFKRNPMESSFEFYSASNMYTEETDMIHGLRCRYVNTNNNNSFLIRENLMNNVINTSFNHTILNECDESKNNVINNNNDNIDNSTPNRNQFNNKYNNDRDIIIQMPIFLKEAMNNMYNQHTGDNTIQNLSENDLIKFETTINNNFNKINDNFLSTQIDTNNNLYNSIQNRIMKSNPLFDFFQKEKYDNYKMNDSLTYADSHNYYMNVINNKRHMYSFNLSGTSETISLNNIRNTCNFHTRDDITNIFGNSVRTTKRDHLVDHNISTYNNSTHNNSTVHSFHPNYNGVNSAENVMHMKNIPKNDNFPSISGNFTRNCSSCVDYQKSNMNHYRNNVTNYSHCSNYYKNIPFGKCSLVKVQSGNIEKDNYTNEIFSFANETHVYTNNDNRTNNCLNQLYNNHVNGECTIKFNETNRVFTDTCKNRNEECIIHPYNIENNIHPYNIKNNIHPYSIENNIHPYSIENNIHSYSIENNIHPYSIENNIHPYSIENNIHPYSIENNIHPYSIENNIHPYSIENNIHPYSIENNIHSYSIENNIHPYSIENNIHPYSIENNIHPYSIENNIHHCSIKNNTHPYGIENIDFQNIINNFSQYSDNYNFIYPLNYNSILPNEENYYASGGSYGFNIISRNYGEKNAWGSKNPYFSINKIFNSEQPKSLVGYDMIDEMDTHTSYSKNDYLNHCYYQNTSMKIKNNTFLNNLQDINTFDKYKNGHPSMFYSERGKNNTTFDHSFHADADDNTSIINMYNNANDVTNNHLLNYKQQEHNNVNNLNALGNSLINMVALKHMYILRDKLHKTADFKEEKFINGIPTKFCNNGIYNNCYTNKRIISTYINDINKLITQENENEQMMEKLNHFMHITNKINNKNTTDILSTYLGSTINHHHGQNNNNIGFSPYQKLLSNILCNDTNSLSIENLYYDTINMNFLRNYNYNAYMYLFYLYKLNEYSNFFINQNVPVGVDDTSSSNMFPTENVLELHKLYSKSCNTDHNNISNNDTDSNHIKDNSTEHTQTSGNSINVECEKCSTAGNKHYNQNNPNISENMRDDSFSISFDNTKHDNTNNYREPRNRSSNKFLNINSFKSVSDEIIKHIEHYHNQLACINSLKEKLLNCNAHNNTQNKNHTTNNSSNLSNDKVSNDNTLSDNPFYLNLLNNVFSTQYNNYSSQNLNKFNKMISDENNNDHISNNINNSSNKLKNIFLNENLIQNIYNHDHIPLIDYYNFQLLLKYIKEQQVYNSSNRTHANTNTCKSDKNRDTAENNGNSYRNNSDDSNNNCNNNNNNSNEDAGSKNRGHGKNNPPSDEKIIGKTNMKDHNPKNPKKQSYSISSLGFSNRSKRWTICPSYVCCNSALCRFKLTCNFKFLQFNQDYNAFNTPYAIYNCYKNIMNKHNYFTSTLCPQQTYLSKHSAQEHETIFNVYWHLLNKEKYKYIQNIILFLDSNLYTRAVWLLKKGYSMDDFEVQKAERKLIKLMILVFKFTHDYKNDSGKYEHIKAFLYSLKNSHINFELMNRFLFY
ncbi:sporozoite and liver stage asparagine-rich protein [Plasmodium gonderi]|uniref:Sporozoite and liver stage asparagine-rich protein n=1 Tax=Plasmodium gonderi TaxID=77519 RepID=A0A1Y1JG44_PLAGO|nr:sporozoite and liver stage asparagine-rich protein [Plasmodium gonderi]GAW81230.1 sporozoite and liver stage asparagine-rich protein [Plasmodium gonderi]